MVSRIALKCRIHKSGAVFEYGSDLATAKEDNYMDNKIDKVPIHLKITLTTKEAAEYSNIGINKIDHMLRSPGCPFVLFVGTKKLVKRKEFEEYISQRFVI